MYWLKNKSTVTNISTGQRGVEKPKHSAFFRKYMVCGVMCVQEKMKRPKSRDSEDRKSHFIAVWCRPGWIVAVNSSALQAVEWCNPSTSCYGFCCSIAIIASGDGRQKRKKVCVCVCVCVCMCVCVYVCPIWCSGMCSDFQSRVCGFDSRRLWSHTSFFSFSDSSWLFFILLGGYQQPVHAGVCGVMCVRKKYEKTKNRDSLARKSHFIAVWCRPGWIVVVNSSVL